MTETAEAIKIQRGLKGVYFDRSPCTFIDGKAGELRYRGYSIHDLAEHSTFEETAWLLLHGELPTAQQLAAFDAELKAARKLPAPVLDIIRAIKIGAPDGRAAHGRLGACGLRSGDGRQFARSHAAQGGAADLAGADDRRRACAHPQWPGAGGRDAKLGHAANFLWMLKGEEAERRRRATDRSRSHSACRARLQRVVVCGARRHRHRGQSARRHHRGHCRACPARRMAAPPRT